MVVSGFLTASVWSRKGGSAFTGFVLGILLGPIGLIIALVGGDQRAKCPYCSERIQADAIICPHCRTTLKSVETLKFRCPKCKGTVNKNAPSCVHCGVKFGHA